jgi:transcriptional regulator with XRE-family HTH domain
MKIGTRIRKIRICLGIKQDELASVLDVSQSYFSKIESNRTRIYVDDLVKIAEYTNTPIAEFFSTENSEEPLNETARREKILQLLAEQNRYLQLLMQAQNQYKDKQEML